MRIILDKDGSIFERTEDGNGYLEAPFKRIPRKGAATIELGTLHPLLRGRVMWTSYIYNRRGLFEMHFKWWKRPRVLCQAPG